MLRKYFIQGMSLNGETNHIISCNKRHNFTSVSENIYIKKIQKKVESKGENDSGNKKGSEREHFGMQQSQVEALVKDERFLSVLCVRHITQTAACYNQHR